MFQIASIRHRLAVQNLILHVRHSGRSTFRTRCQRGATEVLHVLLFRSAVSIYNSVNVVILDLKLDRKLTFFIKSTI